MTVQPMSIAPLSPDVRSAPAESFIAAMAQAATGVAVVTTDGAAGRFGLTVSAVSSVSAEPPLLLVCVNRRSPAVAAITANGGFSVNMLAAHQADVAMMFSGRPAAGAPYDFSRHAWIDTAGGPLLDGAAAQFECAVHSAFDAGTHRVFIGHVRAASSGAGAPLVYAGRNFRCAAPLNQETCE